MGHVTCTHYHLAQIYETIQTWELRNQIEGEINPIKYFRYETSKFALDLSHCNESKLLTIFVYLLRGASMVNCFRLSLINCINCFHRLIIM